MFHETLVYNGGKNVVFVKEVIAQASQQNRIPLVRLDNKCLLCV